MATPDRGLEFCLFWSWAEWSKSFLQQQPFDVGEDNLMLVKTADLVAVTVATEDMDKEQVVWEVEDLCSAYLPEQRLDTEEAEHPQAPPPPQVPPPIAFPPKKGEGRWISWFAESCICCYCCNCWSWWFWVTPWGCCCAGDTSTGVVGGLGGGNSH